MSQDSAEAGGAETAVCELEKFWDSDWFSKSNCDRIRDFICVLPLHASPLLGVGCSNYSFVNKLDIAGPDTRLRRGAGFHVSTIYPMSGYDRGGVLYEKDTGPS